jgi:hypothetical protein
MATKVAQDLDPVLDETEEEMIVDLPRREAMTLLPMGLGGFPFSGAGGPTSAASPPAHELTTNTPAAHNTPIADNPLSTGSVSGSTTSQSAPIDQPPR